MAGKFRWPIKKFKPGEGYLPSPISLLKTSIFPMKQNNHLTTLILFIACIISLTLLFKLSDTELRAFHELGANARSDCELADTSKQAIIEYYVVYNDLKHEDKSKNKSDLNIKRTEEPGKRAKWLMKTTDINRKLADRIVKAANEYRHGDLLLAMLTIESDARPNLKYANNYGLCQVSTVHFDKEEQRRVKKMGFKSIADCGVHSASDLFDIRKNICAANAIFERILKESGGNYALALKKYNANPRQKERYSRRVMKRYQELKNI